MPKWTSNYFHFTDVLAHQMDDDKDLHLVRSYKTCLATDDYKFEPINFVLSSN